MKLLALLCLGLALVGACQATALRWFEMSPARTVTSEGSADPRKHESHILDHWSKFKKQHGKVFSSFEHEMVKYSNFKQNLLRIMEHNDAATSTFNLGLNEYADMDHETFRATMNGYRFTNKTRTGMPFVSSGVVKLPDSVDWRTQGYVTPVKNQGQCGSCWSFSSTGSLEGQHFKKSGKLVSLSEQNLIDCSTKYGNQGCNGGLMDNAFQYVKENDGLDTEASYPYEAEDGKCRFKKADVGGTDTGYVDVAQGDEQQLMDAVATIGPVSVAIDASHVSFQMYSSGIYNEPKCSSDQLDHGVLVVGYGTMDGKDYWLVKNSWGESWGVEGYIYMSRNKSNQCGIATSASYPVV